MGIVVFSLMGVLDVCLGESIGGKVSKFDFVRWMGAWLSGHGC